MEDLCSLYRNHALNPLEEFFDDPKATAFAFENYVLSIYQKILGTLNDLIQQYKVILMDRVLDSCHIFTILNKESYSNFSFLYLTEIIF